jgi:tRNA nucleotidyltransferase (CCA-adding enzyme)
VNPMAAGSSDGVPLPPALEAWLDGLLSDPQGLREVLNRLHEIGCRAWLVGGCVRDALSDVAGYDVDLAVDLEPADLLTAFGARAKDTGADFGTVTLLAANGALYQATTLRIDGIYLDGRRPTNVEHTTNLSEDLARRDLTINAMAVDPRGRRLVDLHGGRRDLEEGVLRAVGNATERLQEDALRILRVYRFAAQARTDGGRWRVERALREALASSASRLHLVAQERVWHELQRLLRGQHALHVLWMMHEDGVMQKVLPQANLATSGLAHFSFQDDDGRAEGYLALLLADLNKDEVTACLRALTAPRRVTERVIRLHRSLDHAPPTRPSEVRLLHHRWRGDVHLHVSTARSRDALRGGRAWDDADDLIQSTPSARKPEPLLDGHAIMAATGLTKGERLGRLKTWLHRIQIEQDVTEESVMLGHLGRLPWNGPFEEWPGL